ncbi:glycosyltransferase [Pontibacter sp. MBLB2868]|uniref:glycosyltransferase n=1 Tax=Pontibacter sp. MBLB2868 TaxID=3451555 RepID=UPI003F754B3D
MDLIEELMKRSSKKEINIAILTRKDYRSPRILAESLKQLLNKAGVTVDIFYNIEVLLRLNTFQEAKHRLKFHFWLRRKLFNFFADRIFLEKLQTYDAVVISECTPNGFWKEYYNIEKLKHILQKPILFYEVYYLNNAPTQVANLQNDGHPLVERYDWHLSVSDVTEIRSQEPGPWSCIGIDLSAIGLKPVPKKEFIALVDFKQPGYEHIQAEQISVLKELGINMIVLEGQYSTQEIREIYQRVSVFFLQFPEAFGLPLAECLACGVQIFTPDSGWPMSWRLDENPTIHGPGNLPNIFSVYSNSKDLKRQLIDFRRGYEYEETPFKIFETFIFYYPHYYYGNPEEVINVLKRIENRFFA